MVTEEEKQQAQSIGLEPEVVFNTFRPKNPGCTNRRYP